MFITSISKLIQWQWFICQADNNSQSNDDSEEKSKGNESAEEEIQMIEVNNIEHSNQKYIGMFVEDDENKDKDEESDWNAARYLAWLSKWRISGGRRSQAQSLSRTPNFGYVLRAQTDLSEWRYVLLLFVSI